MPLPIPVPYVGSKWLIGPSPAAILARLCNGDPLVLRDRVVRRLRDSGHLVHPERVFVRALAQTAHAAMHYRGQPTLAEWLDGIVCACIDELLAEDRAAEDDGAPVALDDQPLFRGALAGVGGDPSVSAEVARGLCTSFNALPEPTRRAFLQVRVLGKRVAEYVGEGHGPARRVRRMVQRAANTLKLPAGAPHQHSWPSTSRAG